MIIKDGFAEQGKGYYVQFYAPDYGYYEFIAALSDNSAMELFTNLVKEMQLKDNLCTHGTLHKLVWSDIMNNSYIGELVATHKWVKPA